MSQQLRVALGALACALAAALVAGCGGKTGAGVSGESGASLIRADTLAYVVLDSDLGSSQWRQVDKLLRKFPAREKWLAELNGELGKQGLDGALLRLADQA
jgi:hypothetical protein